MDPRDQEPNPHAAAIFPPARKLADLRIERVGDDELRTVIGRAALEVGGRLGYPEVTVDPIIERAGISRPVFYRLFADRERCYLHGYEEHAEVLVESLLGTCGSAPSWREDLLVVLERLGSFMVAEPDLAGGLIGQARAVGAAAMAAHDRLTPPLIIALERGTEDAPGVSPPPRAAEFVLAAIESTAVGALGRRDPGEFVERIPDLAALAASILLDDRSAAGG
jgi:AcrR family transcriptional regulator